MQVVLGDPAHGRGDGPQWPQCVPAISQPRTADTAAMARLTASFELDLTTTPLAITSSTAPDIRNKAPYSSVIRDRTDLTAA